MTTTTALTVIMCRDPTPKFPPETFDAIIDQVYALSLKDNERKRILGVFSLVSKSWLPRSRYHLFQTVAVDRYREVRKQAKPFLNLFDSSLCTFKPYVQRLELDGILELDRRLGRNQPWLTVGLPRLSTLPALQDLIINDAKFTSPDLAKLVCNFQNLQLLVLGCCDLGSPTQLIETLSLCTSLKSIGLYELRMDHSDLPSAVNFLPPSSLNRVEILNASNNDIMEWLVSAELETLELSFIKQDASRGIGRCLQRLGPSLKTLELAFKPPVYVHDSCFRDVDLSYNTNIISISFRTAFVPSLLGQITSTEVRDVGRISWGTRYDDWVTIARILDQPNFSKLERLIIPGVTTHDVDFVKNWVMHSLPPGRARDKLIVCEDGFQRRLDSRWSTSKLSL